MKRLSVLLATVGLALCFGAGQAVAMGEDTGTAGQAAGQSAGSGQSASGYGGAYQAGPTNSAGSIRVLSPGSSGDVTQSNTTTAAAIAANDNKTTQGVDQSQTGGYGSDQTQIAGQEAMNAQDADANATALQIAPRNDSSSIRVLSPGDDGDLTQSNSVSAGALAANGNSTDQTADQSQTGGGYGSDATQIAGQEAGNYQSADADATAVQVKPTNTASSIRVLSPGDDGNVTQSNSTTALAAGLNGTETSQSVDQSQGGAPAPKDAKAEDAKSVYPSGSSSTQIAGQAADNYQSADADAAAVQYKPSNTATSIRVLSPGDDGNVTQSNSTTALAAALNGNKTDQSIDQSQTGTGYGSDFLQIAGQGAWSGQHADADATAVQLGAKNEYAPVRVGSPNGKDHGRKDEHAKKDGKGGSIEQSNSVGVLAVALNLNETCQALLQQQSGHGSGLQVAGQGAWSGQSGSANGMGIQGVMRSKK
jgi:hypothetical protein